MSGAARRNLGFGVLALVPVACCIGLPLIAAAGISVAVVAWAGGLALLAVVFIPAAVWFAMRGARS